MLQAFPCATQPHVMTSVGVSGPAVAWEIASARIFHPSCPSRTNTNPVKAAFAGLLLS